MLTSLSILILTHNRPHLFDRCLSSIISNKCRYSIDIHVNNDTCDIKETYSDRYNINYMYMKYDNLYDTYRHLYYKSTGSHILYLEDDDYLLPEFFECIDLNYDINYIEYVRSKKFINLEIQDFGVHKSVKNRNKTYKPGDSFGKFRTNNKLVDFQLTQLLFRKNMCPFPNELYNRDWRTDHHGDEDFINSVQSNSTLKYIKNKCYVQTTDGNDNLTFS